MKKHSGFTLIELMVVMAIIAILATAGLTAYGNYTKKARDSARLQVARQLLTKVEQLTGDGAPPSVAELTTFLDQEGFAYTLPKVNPLIAQISGAINSMLGTVFALPDLDPMSGAPVCYSGLAPCSFFYGVYSDGTYIIAYNIEHQDSVNNFWSITDIVGGSTVFSLPYTGGTFTRAWGNVIGTNPYIVASNLNTYGPDTGNVLSSLSPGVVMTDGDIISDVSDFGAGS